jgi:AcrR family transcriptional regulator
MPTTRRRRPARRLGPSARRLGRDDGLPGRATILKAARQCLIRLGHARVSTRVVAAEAGVNQSLIHYYFGTKDGLILAVLADMSRELLERQAAMYGTHESFAAKWEEACRFFTEDLRSGWVRLLMEVSALGVANPAVGAEVRKITAPWRTLLQKVVGEALEHLGITAVTAEEVTAFIVCFWRGMELDLMLSIPEAEGHHRRSLDAFGRFVGWLEAERAAGRPAALL